MNRPYNALSSLFPKRAVREPPLRKGYFAFSPVTLPHRAVGQYPIRRPLADEASLVHDAEALDQVHDLGELMLDDDEGQVLFDPPQNLQDFHDFQVAQTRQGFIQKQEFGLQGQAIPISSMRLEP